jgi:predicted amidohydrolase
MTAFLAAAVQMRSGRSVPANIAAAEALIREAAGRGARYVLTPEMTSLVNRNRAELLESIHEEKDDPALARFKELAAELGIHLHVGSLAIRLHGESVANRGYLIGPDGKVIAHYDKIHLFDVDLPNGESWRESRTYHAGKAAVVAEGPGGKIGLTICYDVRFPLLYRVLAQSGAMVLAVPSAFARQTGEAHWHVLLRARAIETGSYVIAAAQGGRHEDGRETYGHSLIVDPWGRILAEGGIEPGVILAEIDPEESHKVRARIPTLALDPLYARPEDKPTLLQQLMSP